MAGYSGTPLVRKLGIKEGHRVVFLDAPDGYDRTLGELPPRVKVLARLAPDLDLVQLFARDLGALERRWDDAKRSLAKDGSLWVSWPKRASGVKTDLDGNVVRAFGLDGGLVDVKVCAVDDVWSGLKFVYRSKDR